MTDVEKRNMTCVLDDVHNLFPFSSSARLTRISAYLMKLRFHGGRKRKFHVYELQGNRYVDTGIVEELTYGEYLEKFGGASVED